MNIKRAKEEIEHTVKAYLAKDALGEYAIPAIRQRPILLMGPPGIGKTQIMEQAARECGVALVAYTITHHTRQSAVGLPFIRQRSYGGRDVSVTEYTMSEIIASVYAKMETTGLKEGILFIDEINCVSETLAPTMLQFLQCKTFGNQAVPAGWVIVAAGNPPEYNRSVRDFDIVTLDRVRRMDIEPDLPVWKDYARAVHIHSAILSYLELHPQNFYQINADVDGAGCWRRMGPSSATSPAPCCGSTRRTPNISTGSTSTRCSTASSAISGCAAGGTNACGTLRVTLRWRTSSTVLTARASSAP